LWKEKKEKENKEAQAQEKKEKDEAQKEEVMVWILIQEVLGSQLLFTQSLVFLVVGSPFT